MNQLLILCALIICSTVAYIFKLRYENSQLRYALASFDSQLPARPSQEPVQHSLQPITLPNAGNALKSPPTSLQQTLTIIGSERYTIPLGWSVINGKAELFTAALVNDVNHILITGQSNAGKDNAALNMLLPLAVKHDPQSLQLAIVDGKGLDWLPFEHKAHTFLLATDPEHIGSAMQSLTNERKRRREILAQSGCYKWETYTGRDLPLLVVFISELLLLENAVGKTALTSWLNAELTAARAFGIRYIIACQNASNFSTQWRGQISAFMAGYQPSDSADMPNTGLYTKELTARGVVAPSNLPSPALAGGVFCCIAGAGSANVRTSLISDEQREYWLRQLPNKPISPNTQPQQRTTNSQSISDPILAQLLGSNLLIPDDYVLEDEAPATGHLNAVEAHFEAHEAPISVSGSSRSHKPLEALPISTTLIPEIEQRRIIMAAQKAQSRRQVCKELYNSTGGTGYKNIAMVCDALGLLMPSSGAVVMQ